MTARTSCARAPKGGRRLATHGPHGPHCPQIHAHAHTPHARTQALRLLADGPHCPHGPRTDGLHVLADGPHCPQHARTRATVRTASDCRVLVHIVHMVHTAGHRRQKGGGHFAGGGGVGPTAGRSRQRRDHQNFFIFCKTAIFGPCSRHCHMNRVNCARPRIA